MSTTLIEVRVEDDFVSSASVGGSGGGVGGSAVEVAGGTKRLSSGCCLAASSIRWSKRFSSGQCFGCWLINSSVSSEALESAASLEAMGEANLTECCFLVADEVDGMLEVRGRQELT